MGPWDANDPDYSVISTLAVIYHTPLGSYDMHTLLFTVWVR